ncbi:HSF-type DNA-binding-domain-containing protein [Chlamydoabsidia padenii]|nr:HSF-type DNA-binding-domain-containing protein [Chlamydoabsidia padenii]
MVNLTLLQGHTSNNVKQNSRSSPNEATSDSFNIMASLSLQQYPNVIMDTQQHSTQLPTLYPEMTLDYNTNDQSQNNNNDSPTTTMDNEQGQHNTISLHFGDDYFQQCLSLPNTNESTMVNKGKKAESNLAGRGIAGFIFKLYQCLQVPTKNHTYARWCRHDDKDMFVIDCIPKFTNKVLPRLFKHGKFSSFVRQLNIYGFQRDTDARKLKGMNSRETCRWHHPHFKPGRHDLIYLIQRKTVTNSRRKRSTETATAAAETIITTDSQDGSDNIVTSNEFLHSPNSSPVSHSTGSHHDICPLNGSNYVNSTTIDISLGETVMHHRPSSLFMGVPFEQATEKVNYSGSGASVVTTAQQNELIMDRMLQQQLQQLYIDYNNDYNFYIRQLWMTHAYIKRQKLHLDQLKSTPTHQTRLMHNNQQPTLPTNINSNNDHTKTMVDPANKSTSYDQSIYTLKQARIHNNPNILAFPLNKF